jgi:hypothetical protein
MDPDADPGGPKTYGSYGSVSGFGSGSATLGSRMPINYGSGSYLDIFLVTDKNMLSN